MNHLFNTDKRWMERVPGFDVEFITVVNTEMLLKRMAVRLRKLKIKLHAIQSIQNSVPTHIRNLDPAALLVKASSDLFVCRRRNLNHAAKGTTIVNSPLLFRRHLQPRREIPPEYGHDNPHGS